MVPGELGIRVLSRGGTKVGKLIRRKTRAATKRIARKEINTPLGGNGLRFASISSSLHG
jgi:hypothetical protein